MNPQVTVNTQLLRIMRGTGLCYSKDKSTDADATA